MIRSIDVFRFLCLSDNLDPRGRRGSEFEVCDARVEPSSLTSSS
jgi:hypothetical protein